jgi:hypothetical protein
MSAHSNSARMALGYAESRPTSFPDGVLGAGIVCEVVDFDRSRFPQPPNNVVFCQKCHHKTYL